MKKSVICRALVALALLAGVLVAVAAPAGALLTNPIPADANGDPNDAFTEQDSLWAYVYADLSGGYICAVADTGQPSCNKPAFGRAGGTRVIGDGGLQYVLIDAGCNVVNAPKACELPAGSYRIAVEDKDHGLLSTSDTFFIDPCATCARQPDLAVVAAFKESAARMRDSMKGMCQLQGLLGKVAGKATGMRGWSKSVHVPVLSFGGGSGTNTFNATPSDGGGTDLTFTDPLTGNINIALDILKQVACGAQEMYTNLADDPPDPNFGTVVQPVFASIPALTPGSLDTATRSVDRQRGLEEAVLHGYERYQGAVAAADVAGQQRQLLAVADFAGQLAAELGVSAAGIRAWAGDAAADPDLAGSPLSTADAPALTALYVRIRDTGFTAAETAQLRALGYTDVDIAAIRTHADNGLANAPRDTPYPDAIRAVATTLENEASSVQTFAREARIVAGRLTVNQSPTASFTRTPASGPAPLSVAFNGSASTDPDGTIASYAWDFGDGATGTGATTNHVFTAAGTYTAKLTVTDDKGATGSTTASVTVSPPANQPPVASFTRTPASGAAPLTVAFDGSGSSDPDGTIASYAWDFGDGSTGTGVTASHQYAADGTYQVILTVTDGPGATARAQSTVTVSTGVTNTAPLASILTFPSPASGVAPFVVAFDSSGSSDPDGTIVTSAWNFGDGSSSTNPSPSHTYTAPGTYTATLTVTDNLGATASAAATVTVVANQPPSVTLDAFVGRGIAPESVSLVGSASDPDGFIDHYEWDFGDGSTDANSGPSVVHIYTNAGTFTAKVTVVDDRGGRASAVVTFTLAANQRPTVDISADVATGPAPLLVQFGSTAADGDGFVAGYAWDFGDGGTSASVSASHLFTNVGTYAVRLTVTDDRGGTGTATTQVVVLPKPPNRAPTPVEDVLLADPAASFDVLSNDVDPDADVLVVTGTSTPAHGTVRCGRYGGCRYHATAGYVGPDSFTYDVRDPDGLTARGAVSVDVQARPVTSDALFTNPDSIVTSVGTAKTVNVLANDGGGTAAVTVSTVDPIPTHGSVSCAADGSCTYTPTPGFTGYDGFRYRATDGATTISTIVRIAVYPAGLAYDAAVGGTPTPPAGDPLVQGQSVDWFTRALSSAGVTQEIADALGRPTIATGLVGDHTLDDGSVQTAKGWTSSRTAGGLQFQAGPDALLGDSVIDALPEPTQPISQGTGGDGHVPILVGNRIFAFFHHSSPTSVTCIDRSTGQRCPGYPRQLTVGSSDIIGPAAVVGSKIYVHVEQPNAVTAPITLQCWDTSTDEGCGLVVVDRVAGIPGGIAPPVAGSAPVAIGGKVYLGGGTGGLYCVDPTTNELCGTPPQATGLTEPGLAGLDIVAHGSRVLLGARNSRTVACVDTFTGAACTGWTNPRDLGGWNVLNQHDATGATIGFCVSDSGNLNCVKDASPAAVTTTPGFFWSEDYYSVTAEAEVGSRTLFATFSSGLSCWDWSTGAPCAGGAYTNGAINTDVDSNPLPSAYGAATDGSCVVGLGDPGLAFTVDPSGSSPCTSLRTGTTQRPVDLRAQRCDGTVGAARWNGLAVASVDLGAGKEFSSFIVTVRDATSGQTLSSRELVGTDGHLDLSTVDPLAHPSVTVDVNAVSLSGSPAWADGNPPRIILSWSPDPLAGCFRTATTVNCSKLTSTVGLDAVLTPGGSGPVSIRRNVVSPANCTPPNGAPSAAGQSVSTAEDTAVPVVLVGSDPDGDPLTYAVAVRPAHGSLSGTAPNLVYTPVANYNGPDSFTFTVNDGKADSGPATVAIVVSPVNDVPVAVDDVSSTTGTSPVTVGVLVNDSDVDGDVLAVTGNSTAAHGTVLCGPSACTYTAAAGFVGDDSFTYTVGDGKGGAATATVRVTVAAPANRPPTANGQSVSTVQDTAVPVVLGGADPDGDPLTYAVAVRPVHGSLSGTAPNLIYTPTVGYTGPDSFTFTTNDGQVTSPPATVAVTVTPSSACPVTAPTTDVSVSSDQKTPADRFVSPKFATAGGGELLIALVSADGPPSPNQTVTRVTGAGLTWTLAARSNRTWGTTEVWQAYATTALRDVDVTARLAKGGFDGSITVTAFRGAATSVGAVGVGSGISTTASATVTPTGCNSVIWATGHDWSRPKDPVPAADQTIRHSFVDRRVSDSYWVQTVDAPTTAARAVNITTTGLGNDRWTIAAVEIPAASSTT